MRRGKALRRGERHLTMIPGPAGRGSIGFGQGRTANDARKTRAAEVDLIKTETLPLAALGIDRMPDVPARSREVGTRRAPRHT